MDPSERRRWVAPPAEGEFGGVRLELLDPADQDERQLLIAAEHPELASALKQGQSEVRGGGQVINPTLHIALHQVVAQQVWDDTPPEMWRTAQRLTGLGHDRHEVLHMLMFVVGEDIRRALAGEPARMSRETEAALSTLPTGWRGGADH